MKNLSKIGLLTATLSLTLAGGAFAADAVLSPRAANDQIKTVSVANTDTDNTAARPAFVNPRALGNQATTVAGTATDKNPAMACTQSMTGSSPKAIGACAEHPGAMPCCSVAADK